ncbi:hypothetical protein J3R83DRAFT_7867 [Lanmaoa asiatica]|nr:hypothetical protein J3R83DRAFT_7867 [Lanmaoa asiatica]
MYRQPAYLPSSPPSSLNVTPSSSPIFGPVDSSPPSSPTLVPYSLDSSPRPTSTPFSHPFAASTKAIKRLPNYEKKTDSPPCTPPGTFTCSVGLDRGTAFSRSLQEDDYLSNSSPNASPPSHRTSRYIDREERIWDDALHKPVDTGIGQIDLSNQQLKSIPPSIGDLSGFFNTTESSEQSLFSGRPLARINTEPAFESARTRSFERTQSIKDSGKERHVLKLYLMGNMITSLPPELFSVKNLTVLSLRGNRLTFIPPDICRLTNLHELNISNNQLKFLPWQMRDMKIEKLLVNPNPFLPEPSQSSPSLDLSRSPLRSRRSMTRLHSLRREALSLGPITTKPALSPVAFSLTRVPPLTELCLRLLLAPSETTPPHTVIADYYGLPLSDQWSIPPNVRHTLMDAVPGILRPRKRFSIDTITLEDQRASTGTGTGTGTCPNPAHMGRVFVRHASERFSWERRVAGVDVGGAVPMRWRGCLGTCLDFLDEEKEEQEKEKEKPDRRVVGVPAVGFEGRGEESDVDAEWAVQAVDLGNVSLDMDDFDD